MLVGIVVIIAAVLNNYGGLTGALDKLANVSDPAVSTTPGVFASFFGPDIFNLACVVILTSLGTWGLPQMVQKFYAIKDEKSIKTGTVVSTFFAVIVAGGCYFLGGFGRLTNTDVAAEGYDAIIPHLLECLPPILIGLVVILVLSASMSTLSSLVLTSSSTLTIDFIKGSIAPKMSEKKQVLTMRIMLVVFIAISAVIAVVQYSSKITFIAQLMGVSWGAIAGAFLAPFLYGLYWKKTTVAACWTSIIWGAGIMTLNFISNTWQVFSFPARIQSPINCGALAMIGGLIIVPVVSLFTRKPDQDMVDEAFSCYDETVEVAHRKALD
jgi:SSS family solute:Na+ symporter